MTFQEQVNAAMGAHGLWKNRLRNTIDSGKSDLTADAVADCHRCKFGLWLDGTDLDAAAKRSSHYQTCRDLHQRFHTAVAAVVSLALAGKKQEASRALEPDREFSKASTALTRALIDWKSQ